MADGSVQDLQMCRQFGSVASGMCTSARERVGSVASGMCTSAREQVGSVVVAGMCASARIQVGSVAADMFASAREQVGSVAAGMFASARIEVGSVASSMCAHTIECYYPHLTPPQPTSKHQKTQERTYCVPAASKKKVRTLDQLCARLHNHHVLI